MKLYLPVIFALICVAPYGVLLNKPLKIGHPVLARQSIFGTHKTVNDFLASAASGGVKITGGQLAEKGQFPFAVSLARNGRYNCGGAIIDKRWILTAAHCIKTHPVEEMTITAGTTRISEGGVIYKVDLALMHDKVWDAQNLTNDVGLIHVTKDIEYTDLIQPIELNEVYVEPGLNVTLCGWGRLHEGGHSVDDLHWILLKSITQQQCQSHFNHIVRDYMMCTFTAVAEGSCKGDSGSPLTLDGRLAGVTSWGKDCNGSNPSGFTRVSYFVDWVRRTIAENS